LSLLQRAGAMLPLAFHGGTALRVTVQVVMPFSPQRARRPPRGANCQSS